MTLQMSIKIKNNFTRLGDNYVRQIIECRDELEDNYIIPYIDKELMERLIKKEGILQDV